MQRIEFRAMGCQMSAVVDADSPEANAALDRVPSWFEACEQCLSRFRPDSELSQLNRRAGQWFSASDTLWDVIQAAQEAAYASNGLVTPTLLDALEAAGYDRTFEEIEPGVRLEKSSEAASAEWQAIELDERQRAIRLPPGMRLDLGGVAKGWAADRAARRLSVHGGALVDAGGDIAVDGRPTDGEALAIGVANPFEPDEPLDLLIVESGGVATSGRDYRRWQVDGAWQHHILDPRTLKPARTDVLSATVIAPDAVTAEVAAKVAFILGSGNGLEWIEARPAMAAMLVLETGEIVRSSRLKAYVWHEELLPTWSVTFR